MKVLQDYRKIIEQKKGEKNLLIKQIDGQVDILHELRKERRHIEQAQVILQTVAQSTQQELEYHISDIVSLALEAVFEDPYKLKVEFVVRRNKTEADILFAREGELIDPMSASGGGAVDVASFALRVALWSLSLKKSRNTLILDEPFKFLSSDLQSKAGEMLKQISKKLGLQIIMVSHVPDLIESADKVFEVTMKKGVSVVK